MPVTVQGLSGGKELLIGTVSLNPNTLHTPKQDGRFIAYTYGPQVKKGHLPGMAISVEKDRFLGAKELGPEDQPVSSTYLVRTDLKESQPITYRFTAGWEPGHAKFGTIKGFRKAIR